METCLAIDTSKEVMKLDWKQLCKFFSPERDNEQLQKLLHLAPNSYVGLTKSAKSGRPIVFFLQNTDRSGNLDWLLKRDETFADRIIEVYKVLSVEWDAKITEDTRQEITAP